MGGRKLHHHGGRCDGGVRRRAKHGARACCARLAQARPMSSACTRRLVVLADFDAAFYHKKKGGEKAQPDIIREQDDGHVLAKTPVFAQNDQLH
mmetsp:Transcript_12009/g.39534  ORF Transcript_12009/g.39534 Transcript_12009/m.39534 type:complete len:94 (-) Transcript_12009:956-1237(-)